MRNEPFSGPGAEHREPRNKPQNPFFGSIVPDGNVLGPIESDRKVAAQILQSLRDRRRNHDASGAIAREIIRLGTLAAGLHRGRTLASVPSVPSGTNGIEVALNDSMPITGCDRHPSSEDAA